MLNLLVVIASVRPGRLGKPVADWFLPLAEADGRFEVRSADLLELDLPFMDEPEEPHLLAYTREHTRNWSGIVNWSDAIVFVTPEYNATPAPALKNAIDFLYHEWVGKPAGFVSYGGVWAGARAVQALKPTLTQLGMMPLASQVPIPNAATHLDENGAFDGERFERGAGRMLSQLELWAETLTPIREQAREKVRAAEA
ncbi:MAG: NAD(P)H-dependent oxidoreductase [Solirubrobacterales bacterium]|nr:NAD(P)H-dependent oxidoreductase [Solirubrobacterales bacterium]